MITFSCPNCGKRFSVPDEAAGKAGKCKSCDARVQVPKKEPVGTKESEADVVELEAVAAKPAAARPAPARTAPVRPAAAPDPFSLPDPFASPDPFSTPDPLAAPGPFASADPFGAPAAYSASDPLASPAAGVAAAPSGSVRARRLKAEAQQIAKAFANFPAIRVAQTSGDPPETYRIHYRVRGLQRGPNGQPVFRMEHLAEFVLTRDYPRVGPKCTMLTPVFHPNIEPATICVGDHWTAGQRLVDVIIRVGEMIAYQSYNIRSPLDGEAAMWADLNRDKLPIDPRTLLPPELE
jgi:ubiquitin-protein ligase